VAFNKEEVDYNTLEKKTEEQEQLILDASKHVEMARSQRLLFVSKKTEAKASKAGQTRRGPDLLLCL
jgi:hypothetical protein